MNTYRSTVTASEKRQNCVSRARHNRQRIWPRRLFLAIASWSKLMRFLVSVRHVRGGPVPVRRVRAPIAMYRHTGGGAVIRGSGSRATTHTHTNCFWRRADNGLCTLGVTAVSGQYARVHIIRYACGACVRTGGYSPTGSLANGNFDKLFVC